MENKWKETAKSLGSMRSGEKKVFSFETSRAQENIEEFIPSCAGCTKILKYDPEEGKLNLEFTAGEFPVHLSLEGRDYYNTTKYVTVKYTDKTIDKLYFNVRIYKK